MTEQVTRLVVRADGAVAVLDSFERGMSDAGRATDYTSGAVASFEKRMAAATQAIERGNAVATQTVARKSAEERAWEKWSATVDRTTALRLRLERESAQAAAATANAVNLGYATREQGLGTLMALERRHASQMAAHVAAESNVAVAFNGTAAAADNATASLRSNTAAMQANNGASRMLTFQKRNLQFQLFDVAQTAAMGMNPLMILMQQGPQIAQIWGPDEGGVGRALSETVKMFAGLALRLAPVLAIVGLVSAAIADMTHEINKTSAVTVTFGDTALAIWQVISSGIFEYIKPAIDWLVGTLASFWSSIAPGLKTAGNLIIGTFLVAFDSVRIAWSALPAVMGDIAFSAANAVIEGIDWLVTGARDRINDLINLANNIPGVNIQLLGGGSAFAGIDNPYEGAMDGLSQKIADAISSGLPQDYLGKFFNEVQVQSIKNANDRLAETEEAGNKAGRGLKEARDRMSEVQEESKKLAESLEQSLGGALSSLFDGPLTDFNDAISGILGSFSQLGQQNLSNVFGGLLSGGAANDNGDPGYASVLENAVRIGSRDGTKGGFGDVLKNLPGGAGTLSAGLGGLGIGYQTQNPLMGALAGGLQGAAGGPVGMAVGAVAGFIGGIFAEMEAREKARKEIEASRAAIDQFVAAGMGDEISSYVSALAQFTAQGSKLIELAQKAGDSALVSRLQAANDNYKSVLGGKFADDLEATINALSGLEYINSARDALDRYNQRLADAAMLGVDASRAGTELELSLKKLVVEGKLTADQVAGLAGRFPELATALAQVQSTVALFTGATPDELYASVQRAQAQVDSARAEVQRLQQEQTQALVDQASALETVTRATEQAIKSLRQFKDGLRLDAALSPLSPYDRMTEAQSQFQSLASRALDGDQQAIADLPDISRQYLEEARAYYASSETYFSIFGSVESILDQVLGKAEAQLSEDQKQLNALNAQIEHDRAQTALLGSIDSGVMTLGQAMANLAAAIGVLTAAQQAQQNQSPYSPVVNQLYQDVVGRAPDAAGADYWQNIINSGVEMSDVYRQFIHDVIGLGGTPSISSVSQYGIGALGSGGVPKYADGTMFHAGGMAMVGERGPELLNLPRGSQVFPMTTANDNSSGEMLRELRALRGDVADLRRTSAAGSQAMVNAVGGVGSKLDQAGREAELRTRRG